MKKIIIILLLIIVFTILLLFYYSKRISPLLMKNAKIISKKIAIEIISKDVTNRVSELLDNEDLFIIEKDNNGNIEMIDYNSKVVNNILSITSKQVIHNFDVIETKKDGIISYIPVGVVTNNVLLENLGPKIPIKLVLDGNVLTSLKTNVKEYGINSALVEISVKIEANIDVILPFRTSEIKVVNEVPISIKIVKGNVSSILKTE